MYQFFIGPEGVTRDYVTIEGNDAHHIKNVVRLSCGDEIRVSVRDGDSFICRIAEMTDEFVQADIVGEAAGTELPSPVTLFQAVPKVDRMETVIEKAVELGVNRIVPVDMRFCVVKLSGERAEKKVKKWRAAALAAAKQSKRSVVPEITDIVSFDRAKEELLSMELPLVPYEKEDGNGGLLEAAGAIKKAGSIGVMIGPEGGFAEEEINALKGETTFISLGKRILRTDTAAITALSFIMLMQEMGADDQSHAV